MSRYTYDSKTDQILCDGEVIDTSGPHLDGAIGIMNALSGELRLERETLRAANSALSRAREKLAACEAKLDEAERVREIYKNSTYHWDDRAKKAEGRETELREALKVVVEWIAKENGEFVEWHARRALKVAEKALREIPAPSAQQGITDSQRLEFLIEREVSWGVYFPEHKIIINRTVSRDDIDAAITAKGKAAS